VRTTFFLTLIRVPGNVIWFNAGDYNNDVRSNVQSTDSTLFGIFDIFKKAFYY